MAEYFGKRPTFPAPWSPQRDTFTIDGEFPRKLVLSTTDKRHLQEFVMSANFCFGGCAPSGHQTLWDVYWNKGPTPPSDFGSPASDMFALCARGDWRAVKQLIDANREAGGDTCSFVNQRFSLSNAAGDDSTNSIDVDTVSERGTSAVTTVACRDHWQRELRSEYLATLPRPHSNYSHDQTRQHETTPLHVACRFGHATLVTMLVNCKADLDAMKFDKATPLFLCAQEGKSECVRILLLQKARIDGDKGTGPVAIAARNSCSDVVELLVNAKADLNSAPKTPLDLGHPLRAAVRHANVKTCSVLLRLKADVLAPATKRHRRYRSALTLACSTGRVNIVRCLIEHVMEQSRLHCVSPNAPVVQQQVAATSQPRGDEQAPPLPRPSTGLKWHDAAGHLIAAKANMDECFLSAIEGGWSQVTELLLEVKADPASSSTAILPLVARNNNPKLMNVLLKSKARVDEQSASGATALYVAAGHGHAEVVEALLAANADVGICKNNWSPLRTASRNGHVAVVSLLLASGSYDAERPTLDSVDTKQPECSSPRPHPDTEVSRADFSFHAMSHRQRRGLPALGGTKVVDDKCTVASSIVRLHNVVEAGFTATWQFNTGTCIWHVLAFCARQHGLSVAKVMATSAAKPSNSPQWTWANLLIPRFSSDIHFSALAGDFALLVNQLRAGAPTSRADFNLLAEVAETKKTMAQSQLESIDDNNIRDKAGVEQQAQNCDLVSAAVECAKDPIWFQCTRGSPVVARCDVEGAIACLSVAEHAVNTRLPGSRFMHTIMKQVLMRVGSEWFHQDRKQPPSN